MQINTSTKKTLDSEIESIVVDVIGNFSNDEDSSELRNAINDVVDSTFDTVYLDIRKAKDMELSACNEIIHTHYELNNAGKELILLYQLGHEAEKWIEIAGLDKFIQLAIVHE